MRTYLRGRWKLLSVVVLCAAFAVVSAGCAPLKKKFIRQKKKDQDTDDKFIPVLQPEEYPVKQTGAYEKYAQQYLLFNVWISDYADNFQTSDNTKKLISDLDAALKSVGEMQRLVPSAVADGLGKLAKQVEYLRGEYNNSEAFRNMSRMSSEVRSIERALRKEYKPEMLKDQFGAP